MGKEVTLSDAARVHAQAPSQLAVEQPHALVFYVAMMVIVILTMTLIPYGSQGDLPRRRKIYWGSVLSGALCGFIAPLPNIATGVIVAGMCVFFMVLPAYFYTQLIKIGDRVIAFHSTEQLPKRGKGKDPYNRRTSAASVWWLLVFCTIIGSVNALGYMIDGDELAHGLLGLGILVATGALFGFGDGMHGQQAARGQYLQLCIVTVLSAGIFTVCYLVAHSVGLRFQRSAP